ncbi:hypothetical protein HBI88_101310 [Parastagonospora nodorum]|nr:hypothetical protein HBI95_044330 [Parastagonospora nodorum]KAH5472365.1 hypothetical protein HBI28_136500 [Parastagonospora nodorum]KAH5629236.1 hypothetical protein HBI22_132410 [Parastagonospora nodorum]KAH5720358.1 hypothetical protein HBI20_103930 [Parastagonospora nodorum]KAH5788545.1 hypothetical protein HBI97_075270 [Parastagonospora nodorum]
MSVIPPQTLESRISDLLTAYRAHNHGQTYDKNFAKLTQNIAYLIREREANASPDNVSIVSATRIDTKRGLAPRDMLAVLYRGREKTHKIAVVLKHGDDDWIGLLTNVVEVKVKMALESMM